VHIDCEICVHRACREPICERHKSSRTPYLRRLLVRLCFHGGECRSLRARDAHAPVVFVEQERLHVELVLHRQLTQSEQLDEVGVGEAREIVIGDVGKRDVIDMLLQRVNINLYL
jgi:hypothetical protein